MAPRRKQQAAEPREQGREVKLRVPEYIMNLIEERAKADRRPINATIVNMLAKVSMWEQMEDLGELSRRYEAMLTTAEVSFARYSSEIEVQVLSRELLRTVDMLLLVESDEAVRAMIAQLRVVRAEMRKQQSQERTSSQDRTARR
jgi:hypothetical protein